MKNLILYEAYNDDLVFYPDQAPEPGVKVQGSVDKKTKVAKLGYIKAPHKGSGLGSQYLAKFEKWAKDQGATRVEIDAYKSSIKFWEKMGYTLDAEFPVIDGYKQDFKSGYKEL